MKKSQTANTFSGGMILDLNPLLQSNTSLSYCLNGTYLTHNGNENVLQNDMGNARVESAFLPAGYIPVGTCSFGGIIYVASYNPATKKCQLGSFPSPERNFTPEEVIKTKGVLMDDLFRVTGNGDDAGYIKQSEVIVHLTDENLRIGDLYLLLGTNLEENSSTIKDLSDGQPYVDLIPIIVGVDGTIITLDSNNLYKVNGKDYHIKEVDSLKGEIKVDDYRNLTSSYSNIIKDNVVGRLAILCRLIAPDLYSISYTISKVDGEENTYQLDITPYVTFSTYPAPDTLPANFVKFSDNITPELKNNSIKFTTTKDFVTFTVYPYMPYGVIKYLGITKTIDISKVGTNYASLPIWRYYKNDDKTIDINFLIDAYSELNALILNITFKFENLYDNNVDTRYSEYAVPIISSLNNSVTISLGEEHLKMDRIYLTTITITRTNGTENTIKRLLFTNGQWNEHYLENRVEDFTQLSLKEAFKVGVITTETDTILTRTTTEPGEEIAPSWKDGGKTLGKLLDTIINSYSNYKINCLVGIDNTYNTYSYNTGLDSEYNITLGLPRYVLTRAPRTEFYEDSEKTVEKRIEDDTISIELVSGSGSNFTFKVSGEILTPIDGEKVLLEKEILYKVTPMLYNNLEDYKYRRLGAATSIDGYGTLHWRDLGLGKRAVMTWTYTEANGSENSVLEETTSDLGDSGDLLLFDNWNDIYPEAVHIPKEMFGNFGFGKMKAKEGENGVRYGIVTHGAKNNYGNAENSIFPWIVGTDGMLYPIRVADNSGTSTTGLRSDSAGQVTANLLAQLYYATRDPSVWEIYILNNIIYLSDYQLVLECPYTVSFIDRTLPAFNVYYKISLPGIKIPGENGTISDPRLYHLKTWAKSEMSELEIGNNLTYNDTSNISYDSEHNALIISSTLTLSHVFNINTSPILTIYKENYLTGNAIYRYNDGTAEIKNLKVPLDLLLYEQDKHELKVLTSSSQIYENGTIDYRISYSKEDLYQELIYEEGFVVYTPLSGGTKASRNIFKILCLEDGILKLDSSKFYKVGLTRIYFDMGSDGNKDYGSIGNNPNVYINK